MKKDKFNKFSVPLGLLDYCNPILYCITMITIIKNINLSTPFNVILLIGAIISIFFGFIIPTGKVIVGLGIIKFTMPVILVFLVNLGIFISGLMLLKYVLDISNILLFIIIGIVIVLLMLVYKQTKKTNTVAVLTGFFGYLMIYISLIILAIKSSLIIPVILYALAICLFIMLIGIGIKGNLKNPKVHWVIEITNVLCQTLVMIATLLLFK